jgi:hypothetical protein
MHFMSVVVRAFGYVVFLTVLIRIPGVGNRDQRPFFFFCTLSGNLELVDTLSFRRSTHVFPNNKFTMTIIQSAQIRKEPTWQSGKLPRVYAINLERSPERLKDFMQSFESLGLDIVRVAAVDGTKVTLSHPDYDEDNFRRYHGKRTSMGTVGCYFSHIKALRQFIESGEEIALICEDDVSAKQELPQVLRELMPFKKYWDML